MGVLIHLKPASGLCGLEVARRRREALWGRIEEPKLFGSVTSLENQRYFDAAKDLGFGYIDSMFFAPARLFWIYSGAFF